MVKACAVAMDFAPADSAEMVDLRPIEVATPSGTRGPYLVISVLPLETNAPKCRGNAAVRTLLPTRGIQLSFDSVARMDRSVGSVRVERAGRLLTPLFEQKLKLRRYGSLGFGAARQGWMRIAIRLEDIAPGADGRFAALNLTVQTDSGSSDDRLVISGETLRRAWVAALPELGDVIGQGSLPLRPPLPTDPGLRTARERFEAGDLGTGIGLATSRAATSGVSADDSFWGYANSGLAFAVVGRDDAARVALAQALDYEPCFSFDEAVPAATRALLDALRDPRANCQTSPVAVVAVKSLVLPGFGRPTNRHQLLPRLRVPGAIALLSVGAIVMGSAARDTYDEYTEWQMTPAALEGGGDAAAGLYDDAESQRVIGKALWATAAAIYVTQTIHAVYSERRFARRLTRVQDFGSPPPRESSEAFSVTALPSWNGGAVAIRFTWR